MSDRDGARAWLEAADSLAEFVELATEHGASTESQLRTLLEYAWDGDVSPDRASRVLRRERQRLDDRDRDAPPDSKRAPRYMDLEDLELLSGYEFDHVLAAVLRRVEGEATVTRPTRDRGVDVVWERDDRTVGIRTRPADVDAPVGEGAVEAAHVAATATESDYAIDVPAVVTTSRYTEGAQAAAEAPNVRLYGRSHLERWLSEAGLDAEAMGETLEHL